MRREHLTAAQALNEPQHRIKNLQQQFVGALNSEYQTYMQYSEYHVFQYHTDKDVLSQLN